MSAKHSPGPWEAINVAKEKNDLAQWGIVCKRQPFSAQITDIAQVWNRGGEKKAAANARLIAAAPDGLAAARKALDECADLIGTPAGNALQAFINKAVAA